MIPILKSKRQSQYERPGEKETTMITLLVAHDLNRVIGVDNKMPWHIPEELGYFKKVTMGKAIVMGRKTFESIGKVLPGRLNIIITRNEEYSPEGAEVVHSLKEAIELGEKYSEEVVIIGGAEIFNLSMEIADKLYITVIQNEYDGDTYFPNYGEGWKVISESAEQHSADRIVYSYLVYERK